MVRPDMLPFAEISVPLDLQHMAAKAASSLGKRTEVQTAREEWKFYEYTVTEQCQNFVIEFDKATVRT